MIGNVDQKKSSKILQKVQAQKDRNQIVNVDQEEVKFVIFMLDDEYFALYGDDVIEILPSKKVHFVPGSPDFIRGVINVRGDLESVIDLNHILGFPSQKAQKKNRIIIAEKKTFRSGILVGSVEDVLDLPKSSIKESSATSTDSGRNFFRGTIDYKDRCVALLDLGFLFSKNFTKNEL